MKFSILFRFVIIVGFLCLLTTPAAAQYYNTGIGSYTSIDYDEETNTVTAYSQTEADYELRGDYQASVSLSVSKSNGVTAAHGTAYDYGNGYASILLSFAGEPSMTYTAVGRHKSYSLFWENDYGGGTSYFDNWGFSNFEAKNIYQPWSYFFSSPGYYSFRQQSIYTNLGRTYDSVSTTVASSDIKFKTISNDVNNLVATFSDDGITTQTATVNLIGDSHPVCGTNRASFNITINFDLPPGAFSIFHPDVRTFITDSPKQQFQYLSFGFDGTTYSNGKGKMVINVRQVRDTATDKSFKISIAGGLQSGGSYNGNARVRFTCP